MSVIQGHSLLHRLKWNQSKCPLYRIVGCRLLRGFEVYGDTIRHSELSIILQVSAIEGCPLSSVPLQRRLEGSN